MKAVAPVPGKCGARTTAGGFCKRDPMPNGKCYRHGGATPEGIASPHFKHGKYSKNLPTRMIGDFHKSLANPDSLALTDDVALLDARLEDILGRVDTGESGEMWRSLLSSVKEAQRQRKRVNCALSLEDRMSLADASADLNDALDSIEVLAQGGVSDYAAWREVKDLLEQRRKHTESETKRRVQMQQMMTQEKSDALLAAVKSAIILHVRDPQTLRQLSAELRRIEDQRAASAGELVAVSARG